MAANIKAFIKALENGDDVPTLLDALGVSSLNEYDLTMVAGELARIRTSWRRRDDPRKRDQIAAILESYDGVIKGLGSRAQDATAALTQMGKRNFFVGYAFALGGVALTIYWGVKDVQTLGVILGIGLGGFGLTITQAMEKKMVESRKIFDQITSDADAKLSTMLGEMRRIVDAPEGGAK